LYFGEGLAIQWFKDGMNPREERGKEAYNARLKCYQNIVNILNELLTGIPPAGTLTNDNLETKMKCKDQQ
jgi:hypothetical protein